MSQIDEGIAQEHTPETDSGTSPVDSASLRKMIDKINECTLNEKAQTKEEKQIKELFNHQQKLQEYESKLAIMGARNS